jgi:hypothetical protein
VAANTATPGIARCYLGVSNTSGPPPSVDNVGSSEGGFANIAVTALVTASAATGSVINLYCAAEDVPGSSLVVFDAVTTAIQAGS